MQCGRLEVEAEDRISIDVRGPSAFEIFWMGRSRVSDVGETFGGSSQTRVAQSGSMTCGVGAE
jgi:hypothetical protein